MENVDGDKENMPNTSTADQDVQANPAPVDLEKKRRRRSSVGADLMAAFFKDEDMNKITVPDQPLQRPRRKSTLRTVPVQSPRKPRVVRRPIRYSFDVGHRPSLRPCIRNIEKPKKRESLAQKAAKKVIDKYHRNRSISKTPRSNRSRNFRFSTVCTIRVITPRPQYDPDNLCFPSDDEDSGNPNRERLSTVNLDITPSSQAYLDSIKDKDVDNVQFRAKMIFGDGEDDIDSEPTSTCTEGSNSQSSDVRRRKRRKSLIVGAASPLKTPPSKEETDDQKLLSRDIGKEPKACQKSLNFDKNETAVKSSSDSEIARQRRRERRSGIVKLEENIVNATRKSRRKTVAIKLENCESFEEIVSESSSESREENPQQNTKTNIEKKNRRRSTFVDLKPTKDEPSNGKVTNQSNRRRSQRFEIDIVKTNDVILDKSEIQQPATSSKSCDSVVTPKTTSAQPTKLFSLFSPRPKKVVSVQLSPPVLNNKKSRIETEQEIVVVDTELVANSSSSTITSNRREDKLKGDRIAPTYAYFTNMPIVTSFSEKNESSQGKNWISSIPRCSKDTNENKYEFKMASLSSSSSSADVEMNSVERPAFNPENVSAIEWKPSRIDELVEGEDEAQRVRLWLKKWKKKVRKEAKKQEENSKNKGRKSFGGKKKCADYSSDEDYEESDEEELENPLILIGPTGVGKTAFVTALAAEENMKIIGMGPEDERRGTTIKSQLTEAMRSHRVVTESPGSLTTFFQKRTVVYEKSSSQATSKRKSILDQDFTQSLIVFEHVDLLFGALDRNAASALIELANTAMVPVVWTCDKTWPSKCAQIELEKKPLEVYLRRRRDRVRDYCQQLIRNCNGVQIDDKTMRNLSKSVNYDLRATIQQAHFFSLLPHRPLPSTSRIGVSDGFNYDWNVEKKPLEALEDEMSDKKLNEVENYASKYEEIIQHVPDGCIRLDFPRIQPTRNNNELKLNSMMQNIRENIQLAYTALNGMHSPRDTLLDMIPYLDKIDRAEQYKRSQNRRHQHRFTQTTTSTCPIDDDKLIRALGRLRSEY